MAWLVLTIAAWGVLHSWLASLSAKEAARRVLGASLWRTYRLAYNVLAVITFAPIILLLKVLPDHQLYSVQPPWLVLMLAGEALAAVGLLVAIRQTDAWALIGLKQLTGREESAALVTTGLYRYVRHPMYLFGLLVVWLAPVMSVNSLICCLALTTYVLVGAYFEEKKLAGVFGAAYTEYKRHTPMIIPIMGPTVERA